MNWLHKAYVVLILATAPNVATAAEMNDDSALVAIDAAIQSMKQEPNQFNVQLSCTVTGVHSSVSGGGTGINVTTTGGGVGSQTTGMHVSASDAQCDTAQSNAINALNEQAIKQLSDIKALLQAPTVDKPTIMSKLSELGKEYIAPALRAVIEALIKKT
jgi:hypothetical protein